MKSPRKKIADSYQKTLLLTVFLTVVIFALLTALVSLRLRKEIRKQIESRDAEVLYSLALMNQRRWNKREETDSVRQWKSDNRNLTSAIRSSELHGVIGLQLFDREGNLKLLAPENLIPAALNAEYLSVLRELKTISRFHPAIWLDVLYVDDLQSFLDEEPVPLLEVVIPMHAPGSQKLRGIVQYWIDGKSLAGEFAILDRNLLIQAGFAFCGGTFIIVLILTWSFGRLRKTGLALEKRSDELIQANRELVLAAKMSAIGAISSHLVHGLKNPLAGLKAFVSNRPPPADEAWDGDRDWQTARETTNRMVEMVQEIVRVIREEDGGANYEITWEEICEIVAAKARDLDQPGRMVLENEDQLEATFSSREGNVIVLILNNLVKNALEAVASGGGVVLACQRTAMNLEIRVKDNGSGMPENVTAGLFQPCISSKPQGAGIGLAISRQLGKHIGAELSLERTGVDGTCFLLILPLPD